MPTTSTPLRYPGGKSRLARYISFLLRKNRITDCTYVEPFAGGAGAAINLLRREYVRVIHLNDIDKGIYAFWHSVIHNTDALCGLVEDTAVTIDEWHKQRSVLSNAPYVSLLELGFAVFFMNRTNRSGIIKGGVIGGLDQSGDWKIDARYNKDDLINKIRRIGAYRDRIRLSNLDALDFLVNVVSRNTEKQFIYLDPPYYRKGQALYENHYGHEDHVNLRNALDGLGDQLWVVSYDNVPEIRDLYEKYTRVSYGIAYSAARRYEGKEVMFFCPKMAAPQCDDPLKLRDYA